MPDDEPQQPAEHLPAAEQEHIGVPDISKGSWTIIKTYPPIYINNETGEEWRASLNDSSEQVLK
jgi:hypothetical protein